jgi:hypothetical protein
MEAMGRLAAILLGLLAITGTAWLVVDPSPPPSHSPPPEARSQTDPGTLLPPPASEPSPGEAAADAIEAWPDKSEDDPSPTASESGMSAGELAGFWMRCAIQREDANLRAETKETVRLALLSRDPVENLAALLSVSRVARGDPDRARFRPLVRRFLDSEDADLRSQAVVTLRSLELEEPDFDRLLDLAKDPDLGVRLVLLRALCEHAEGRLTGRVGDAVLDILATDDVRLLRFAFARVSVSELSPRLETRFLELARLPELRIPVAQALCRMTVKSERVAEFLIDLARGPDRRLRSLAVSGLLRGLPRSVAPRVEALFRELLEDPGLEPELRSKMERLLEGRDRR